MTTSNRHDGADVRRRQRARHRGVPEGHRDRARHVRGDEAPRRARRRRRTPQTTPARRPCTSPRRSPTTSSATWRRTARCSTRKTSRATRRRPRARHRRPRTRRRSARRCAQQTAALLRQLIAARDAKVTELSAQRTAVVRCSRAPRARSSRKARAALLRRESSGPAQGHVGSSRSLRRCSSSRARSASSAAVLPYRAERAAADGRGATQPGGGRRRDAAGESAARRGPRHEDVGRGRGGPQIDFAGRRQTPEAHRPRDAR